MLLFGVRGEKFRSCSCFPFDRRSRDLIVSPLLKGLVPEDFSSMATESGRLDYWRKYFRSADCNIFALIEKAILLAATDYPADFRQQRDRIAERLFSCLLPRCSGCDRAKEQPLPEEGEFVGGDMRGVEGNGRAEKESKVNSCAGERSVYMNRAASNYSYEAEALTEEMEEKGQLLGEVAKIKEVLAKKENETETVLRESLKKLQLIVVSVDILKETEIGKTVADLRKHRSREIRQFVKTLIDEWKVMVDDWVAANGAVTLTESTSESVNPSVADNEEGLGLPSPPIEAGVLFANQSTMELSQFFDDMDDDGNPQNYAEFDKSQESQRESSTINCNDRVQKQQISHQLIVSEDNLVKKQDAPRRVEKPVEVIKRSNLQEFFTIQCKLLEDVNKQNRQPESLNKQNRQSAASIAVGPGRPQRIFIAGNQRSQWPKEITGVPPKKPFTNAHQMLKCANETSVRDKIEAAKRKLHERYQQADDAKKQRMIQVMELQDIPKQGVHHRQPFNKQGNSNSQWANIHR